MNIQYKKYGPAASRKACTRIALVEITEIYATLLTFRPTAYCFYHGIIFLAPLCSRSATAIAIKIRNKWLRNTIKGVYGRNLYVQANIVLSLLEDDFGMQRNEGPVMMNIHSCA
jgi:hypothetical protein